MGWSEDPGRVAPYLEEVADDLLGRGLAVQVERTEPVYEFASLVVTAGERSVELDLFSDGSGALVTEDRLPAGMNAAATLERITAMLGGRPAR